MKDQVYHAARRDRHCKPEAGSDFSRGFHAPPSAIFDMMHLEPRARFGAAPETKMLAAKSRVNVQRIRGKTMRRSFAAFVAFTCGLFVSTAVAQEMPDLEIRPHIILGQEGGMGVIDDLHVTTSGSSVVSFTNENGVKTTKVADRKTRLTIVEDPASGITCKVTKTYGLDDLDALEQEQPELFMHLSAIPKTINESEVEVTVGVTTSYTAADKDELKSKHPDVFKLYDKYSGEKAIRRMGLGRAMPMLRLREGFQFVPDDGEEAMDDDEDDDDGDDEDDDGDDGDEEDGEDEDDDDEDDGDGEDGNDDDR